MNRLWAESVTKSLHKSVAESRAESRAESVAENGSENCGGFYATTSHALAFAQVGTALRSRPRRSRRDAPYLLTTGLSPSSLHQSLSAIVQWRANLRPGRKCKRLSIKSGKESQHLSQNRDSSERATLQVTLQVTNQVIAQVARMLHVLTGEQSRLQKYRLPQNGKAWLTAVGGGEV